MRIIKKIIAVIIITMLMFIFGGCWNYREIESLAIVSCAAIDEGENGGFYITVETVIVEASEGNVKNVPQYTELNGDTFFEAIRDMITVKGKKLYWSHAKAILISEQVAKKDISQALDFMYRDAEIREDTWILIVKGTKAGELLKSGAEAKEVMGFKINDVLKAQSFVSRFFSIPLFDFLELLSDPKTSTLAPTIQLIEVDNKKLTQVIGTAFFKSDRLIGYLDEDDSKSLLVIRNKLQRGLYVVNDVTKPGVNVALEIFKNKTKLRPYVQDGALIIAINTNFEANIAEITGSVDLISDEGRVKLKKIAEKQMKQDLEKLIKKAQEDYKMDFLNFKNVIMKKQPAVWKQIADDWDTVFPEIKTEISINVHIRGSAIVRKPILVGE